MSEDTSTKPEEKIPTSSIVDMMLSGGRTGSLDAETLIKETHKRVWGSLNKGYEFGYTEDDSDQHQRRHATQSMHMIVMFVDLVGSTEMSLILPAEKLGIIISSFSQEMRYVLKNYGGYVLKYVGDAVIGYFVAEENPLVVSDNAVNCAKTMIDVIERGINPILSEYDYPELRVKIGMDFGENAIVRYGSDKTRSHVDILGPAVSIAAKITALARPNQILIGEDVHEKLHPSLKDLFKKVEWHGSQWNYHNRETGRIYDVYALHV